MYSVKMIFNLRQCSLTLEEFKSDRVDFLRPIRHRNSHTITSDYFSQGMIIIGGCWTLITLFFQSPYLLTCTIRNFSCPDVKSSLFKVPDGG